ncbi:hypothetical protein PV327_004046 [Microctonus hyperodae]|uniref:BHLH domain-containing protein n=2 Tax=Microctonus hyperodae TaxID=165561 RepID=A0AA39G5J8_MICHY|nr:hypothetical protein PV327_004046 [Microctonus hyperodae]
MSVFSNSDERMLIEEIVEAVTEGEQENFEYCSVETIDECSVPAITIVEITDDHQNQQDQGNTTQESHLSDKNIVTSGRHRLANHNILNSDPNDVTNIPRSHMEQEKRMRREIANSNERRRMQSINAGFQSLRTLLPHHEGEKLSKAAILQQTAEYIYQLEQQKTQLLSQNCQLKRLVNQHEGGDVPIKKRKTEARGVVVSLPMHVSESADEGLGSMSPEPLSVITVSTDGHSVVSNNINNGSVNSEIAELRRQLELERQQRIHLEKQLHAVPVQHYSSERFRDNQLVGYQPHEVIEHTNNVMVQETEEEEDGEEEEEGEEVEAEEEDNSVTTLQVVSVMSIPAVGSTQTVETTNPDTSSPPLSPQPVEIITEEIIKEEESRATSPKIVAFTANNHIFTATIEEQSNTESFSPSRISYPNEINNPTSSTQFITASPTRPFSPVAESQRLPSVLEAAMKAEPKVEVERLPSPASSLEDGTPQARLYLANTSRQNLETIVEAIRHLEGDHLFSDEPAQDVPLALTNKSMITSTTTTTTTTAATTTTTTTTTIISTVTASSKQRLLHAEVNNFLQFHSQKQTAQQRPGVIVAKHS